jgi:hypothetical protein
MKNAGKIVKSFKVEKSFFGLTETNQTAAMKPRTPTAPQNFSP